MRPSTLSDIELSEDDLSTRYDDFLDEVYPDLTIAGYSYNTSNALREIDPTAYRCGYSDWLDSEIQNGTIFELNDKYYSEDPTDLTEEESED